MPTQRTAPPWLARARTYLGVREVAGRGNSPTIMAWIRKLGARALGIDVKDDLTPWCGTFTGICIKEALPDESLPPVLVRAKAWLTFGRALSRGAPGAVMVFDRAGGGHVSFYVGEDRTHYHVLGGNQGNSVSIMRLAKDRLSGIRWPRTWAPEPGEPVMLTAAGTPASANEA